MNEKAFTYIVEVLFNQVVINNTAEPAKQRNLDIASEVFSFSDDNKSIAKQNAEKFYDRVIRYGLTRNGGSVIKSTIPPSSILNVGIIDLQKYKEEMEAAQNAQEEVSAQEADALAPIEQEFAESETATA